MTQAIAEAIWDVIRRFDIPGQLEAVEPLHRGHIHDTFISTWRQGGAVRRYLHQRMNDKVFHDIPAVMHNIETISRHLRRQMGDATSLDGFRILDLVPTRERRAYLVCAAGQWRTYVFIEGTTSHDKCAGPDQAYEAARAFGWFQARLANLDAEHLRETLPRFFSTPHRMQQFEDALAEDPMDRAQHAVDEVRFAQTRRGMAHVIEQELKSGRMPMRIVHGDTKLNNVLFDPGSRRAACIVDLDTCMPGYSLYDFGDLVRFTAATSAEDEPDLSQVGTDLELYRALEAGYREATASFLTPAEVAMMPFAARLVTFTIGLRFLADHLAGDVYFKVQHPGHNLDRARVQFRMVASMEERADAMAPR